MRCGKNGKSFTHWRGEHLRAPELPVRSNEAIADPLVLAAHEIHVWLVRIGGYLRPEDYRILSSSERRRAESYKFRIDAIRYVRAHAALRQILSCYVGIDPGCINFFFNEYGKPMLKDYPEVQFNLSHSGSYTLIGIAKDRQIGVDIEVHRPDIDYMGVAGSMFSEDETLRLKREPTFVSAFFDCWVRKEAFIKAIGKGLSHPLKSFSVPFGRHALSPSLINDEANNPWQLWGFTLGSVSAAVVNQVFSVQEVHLLRWKRT